MPTTPRMGLPYPSPTAVPDVPYDLQQLAQAVDAKLASASGTYTQSLPTAQAPNNTAVTFPAGRFTAAPSVAVNRTTGISWASLPIIYYATSVTATGFVSVGISAATGGAATMQYAAVQAA